MRARTAGGRRRRPPAPEEQSQAPAALLRAPSRSGPRFGAKTALHRQFSGSGVRRAASGSARPARTSGPCAPDATSRKLFFWAVFAAPGASARFGGRHGTWGPVPVHFGRVQRSVEEAGAWRGRPPRWITRQKKSPAKKKVPPGGAAGAWDVQARIPSPRRAAPRSWQGSWRGARPSCCRLVQPTRLHCRQMGRLLDVPPPLRPRSYPQSLLSPAPASSVFSPGLLPSSPLVPISPPSFSCSVSPCYVRNLVSIALGDLALLPP